MVSLGSFSPMMLETLAELAMKLVMGEMSYETVPDTLYGNGVVHVGNRMLRR